MKQVDIFSHQFKVFSSNRLESLAQKLADILSQPLASPLHPETIVVQSRGMERWLSMELAKAHGVCANVDFPFPNRLVEDCFRALSLQPSEASPFEPRTLQWTLMKLLPRCLDQPEFAPLKTYLSDAQAPLKGFQLCSRLAGLFDQYLMYRPEMIFAWEAGKPAGKDAAEAWQAVLWQKLISDQSARHRAALGLELLQAIQGLQQRPPGFPHRIAIFGISALPAFHIQVFFALSRILPVHLFMLSPCREYWGHILSHWERRRMENKAAERDLSEAELHAEKENSLLSSLGGLGRDFLNIVLEYTEQSQSEVEEVGYPAPGRQSLLACIQSDILELNEPAERPGKKATISALDRSVCFHSCHSPMREVQVLHDQLLAWFDRDPGLEPRHILVMIPQIESYAPYIQAVFDRPKGDSRRIPFSIADRSLLSESRIMETFMRILDLCGGRFEASAVLAVLEAPEVLHRFDLTEADLEPIERWIRACRIRWGIDGKSRQDLGLPDTEDHTWTAGLNRLLLGYAMPGGGDRTFEGILPFDSIEGGETQVLGRWVEFAYQLFEAVRQLEGERSLSEWARTLEAILDGFFAPTSGEGEAESRSLRRFIRELGEHQESSGFDSPVDLSVIRAHLSGVLNAEGFGLGFITGGVTFCAMLPMRSIPFEFICLLGMNGDQYPRQSKPLGFDLMARAPRPGDRSVRNDDRYLFLESIISARKQLYISYTGQSIQDNSTIPPSVLVSELMDYIRQNYQTAHAGEDNAKSPDPVTHQLLTIHPLQPFSPAYFQEADHRLFSYSQQHCQAAQALLGPRTSRGRFIPDGISEPEPEWQEVHLSELSRFFAHPARFLLNRRLNIHLEEELGPPEENEPFVLEGLESYFLGQDLLEKRLAGEDISQMGRLAKLSGRLPHGNVGDCLFSGLKMEVERLADQLESYLKSPLKPLDLDISVGSFRLHGRISGFSRCYRVQYRYANIKAKDRIQAWISHLALQCQSPGDYPRQSLLAGRDAMLCYGPVENAADQLEALLNLYWRGLQKPLLFFPESSWAYASQRFGKDQSHDKALYEARKVWEGGYKKRGESEDPYFSLCFPDLERFENDFVQNAKIIFNPLIRSETQM